MNTPKEAAERLEAATAPLRRLAQAVSLLAGDLKHSRPLDLDGLERLADEAYASLEALRGARRVAIVQALAAHLAKAEGKVVATLQGDTGHDAFALAEEVEGLLGAAQRLAERLGDRQRPAA